MRLPKYKWWDYNLKMMCDVWDIGWKAWHLPDNILNYVTIHVGLEGCETRFDGDGELLEYTGEKDKNGVETCEGDRVTVYEYLNGKIDSWHDTEIVFEYGAFRLKEAWCNQSLSRNTIEVIGNKWEGIKGE